MTTDCDAILPVRLVDDDLVIGTPQAEPARRVMSACLIRADAGPRLELHYDPDGCLAYVFVGHAIESWPDQRRSWGYEPHDDDGPPETLWIAAERATLHFTDDPGMYLDREDTSAEIAPWNGVAVDLTEGALDHGAGRHPAATHWGDWEPTGNCHEGCHQDETRPHFSLCLMESGRVNGIFVEAPEAGLPRPTNADLRERRSGRWPDTLE